MLTGSPFLPGSPERPGIPGSPYSRQERSRAVSRALLNAHPRAAGRGGDPIPLPRGQAPASAISLLLPAGGGDPKGRSLQAPSGLLWHPVGTHSPSRPCPHRGRRRLSCPGPPARMRRGVRALLSWHGSWLGEHRWAEGPTHLGAAHAQGSHVALLSPGSRDPITAGLALRESTQCDRGSASAPWWGGSGTETWLLTGSPGSPDAPTSPWGRQRHRSGQGKGMVPLTPPSTPLAARDAQLLTFCPPGPRAPGKPVEPFSPCSPLAPCKQKPRSTQGRKKSSGHSMAMAQPRWPPRPALAAPLAGMPSTVPGYPQAPACGAE